MVQGRGPGAQRGTGDMGCGGPEGKLRRLEDRAAVRFAPIESHLRRRDGSDEFRQATPHDTSRQRAASDATLRPLGMVRRRSPSPPSRPKVFAIIYERVRLTPGVATCPPQVEWLDKAQDLNKIRKWKGLGGTVPRLLLPVVLLLGGCTSVGDSDEVRAGLYLGAVSVSVPATRGHVSAVQVKTLGLGWDGGPFLGWRSGSWIEADPAKCQLLVVIRAPAEAANAVKVIESLEGQNPCIVDFTNTLRS